MIENPLTLFFEKESPLFLARTLLIWLSPALKFIIPHLCVFEMTGNMSMHLFSGGVGGSRGIEKYGF